MPSSPASLWSSDLFACNAARQPSAGAVDVGPGTKWANPIKRCDVEALIRSESDIAEACKRHGWKAGATLLYRATRWSCRKGPRPHLQVVRSVARIDLSLRQSSDDRMITGQKTLGLELRATCEPWC